MKNTGILAAAAMAMLPGAMTNVNPPFTPSYMRPRSKNPTMVTASDAAIAEWNRNVKTRQVLRSKAKPWKARNKRRMVPA